MSMCVCVCIYMSGYVCMLEYIDCTEVAFHPGKIRGSRAIDKTRIPRGQS